MKPLPKICAHCKDHIDPPEWYRGRVDRVACPEFGLVDERDSCKGFRPMEDEEE
jgi:hypothetical protein